MFILGKAKILHGRDDITEMAFLLYACVYWAVMLAPADITCELIEGRCTFLCHVLTLFMMQVSRLKSTPRL